MVKGEGKCPFIQNIYKVAYILYILAMDEIVN
jgi:hypothetical protein